MKSQIGNCNSKILIVGAGPAGSSLAIRLAHQGFDVTLLDKEAFPRHKLCGEFISPECLPHFEALGVVNEMLLSGGERIHETRFYDRRGRSIAVPSKWFVGNGDALSLSRSRMDECLLAAAKTAGVEVLESTAAVGVTSEKDAITSLQTRDSMGESRSIKCDLLIDATGRSAILSKLISRSTGIVSSTPAKSKLVAFKAHLSAPNVSPGRCEIYSYDGGYGGLSPVEDGLANLCFVVTSAIARSFGGDAERLMREVVCKNPRASASLANAMVEREWLAVAIQGFGRNSLRPAANVFSIGDAAGFIDPFTGSGILMAFESSDVLAGCIAEYESDLVLLGQSYEKKYAERFGSRLRISALLRHAAFHPRLATAAISLFGISKRSREFLAKRTRGEYLGEN